VPSLRPIHPLIAGTVISTANSSRRWLVWILRIAVLVVVCLGVSGTVRHAVTQLSEQEWELRPAWLLVTGAVYVLGLVPVGWFGSRVFAALGYPTPLVAALRAYFLGHVGKYVPGKAIAVILRVAAVRKWVPSTRIVLIAVLVETLTMMAAGAFFAFVLSAFVLKSDPFISWIALGMAVGAGAPTLPPISRWLSALGVRRAQQKNDESRLAGGADPTEQQADDSADITSNLHGITFKLLAVGWIAASVYWVLMGVSLWSTLRAIGVDRVGLLADLPVLITAVSFAMVAGFASMLPGGIGVRDAVLMQLLVPVCGEVNAMVAAVLMRLVWLVSELITCGILYIGARSREQGAGSRG
jgi:uncharacterized membrane protein YbhN (UPF0104 family)